MTFAINTTLTKVDEVFSGGVQHLMPRWDEIPEEFRRRRTPWNELFTTLFYKGGSIAHLVAKEGVDGAAAIRHISCVMRSWEPKHEHKEAAVAFLFSEWFEPIRPAKETK